MKIQAAPFLAAFLFVVPPVAGAGAGPEWRVVRAAQADGNLLANGGFGEHKEGVPAGWRSWEDGFAFTSSGGRDHGAAVVCEVREKGRASGVGQTLVLNRSTAAPLVVRGWSKAEGVEGSPDSGYAVYVDILYADGTPLWGQTANFRCGTHDWQERQITITPEKPVKSLSLYCLLRGHKGKVWFDDISLTEIKSGEGAALFQGLPVTEADAGPAPQPLPLPASAAQLGDHANRAGRFLVRDVAADSDFFRCGGQADAPLDLRVTADITTRPGHVAVAGRLTSVVSRDRAVTLVYALPLDATGWRWGDDIRRHRPIAGGGEFTHVVPSGCGATGTMSLYPVGAVWNDQTGVAIALDLAWPAVCRVGYHAGLKALFIAYDFGLAADTERFPSSAEFRFVLFAFDPAEGFRSAWGRYTTIFPGFFVVRSRDQGLWMPFTDVATVAGWEDFGFRYHEGNNNVPWDDAHGVLSFRYTEPMTWWMPMEKGLPRTPAAARAVRDQLAAGPDARLRRMAEVSRVAAMHDESGQPCLRFEDTPWCDGAVWSLNPNPWVGTPAAPADGAPQPSATLNAATVHWSQAVQDELYGPAAKGRLDGEYLDSIEGYVTADLNFRREHFRTSTVPLVFATDTRQPALFKGLAVCEFTRWLGEDVHRRGGLLFANGVPYRFAFLCPWLDVMGTETNWLAGGGYQPAALPQMDLWRTLAGGKPYLLLMNTDYDRFTPDLVEKYFNRCLFYGMWPGFFSHNASDDPYWRNRKWYDRDRPLFRKYLPRIKQVAEAGWRPVTDAVCDNPAILLERFGPNDKGEVFLTAFNDTARPESGTVRLRPAPPGDNGQTWSVTLHPQEAGVIEVGREQ